MQIFRYKHPLRLKEHAVSKGVFIAEYLHVRLQARTSLLITAGRFPQILDILGFGNWGSQWLSRGNLDF